MSFLVGKLLKKKSLESTGKNTTINMRIELSYKICENIIGWNL